MKASNSPARFLGALTTSVPAAPTSPSARTARYLVVLIAALLAFPSVAFCQDSLILKTGVRREGKILGVSDGTVRLQIRAEGGGEVQANVRLADIETANMAAPEDVALAQNALLEGNAAQALQKLQPLVANFQGLPAQWTQTATLLLADAQIETDAVDAAEATLVAFQQNYPEATEAIPLLRAKIAIGRNNFVGAKPLLAPIIAQAEQTRLADSTQSVTYGQAYYLRGRIHEHEGNFSRALEDYIRSSTIFFEDRSTASRAEERAQILVDEKGAVVP